jgi:hypothetical protein
MSILTASIQPPRLNFRAFQTEQLCRAATHDGAILSWEPGLGKTLAGIAWALIKRARRVLIVAPGGLHKQWREEAWNKFRMQISDMPDVRTFCAFGLDRPASGRDGQNGRTRFYITSYQDLAWGCASAEAIVSERGNVACIDPVDSRVAKMRLPSVERLPLIFERAGLFRGDVGLPKIRLDVIGELRLVPAHREHLLAPIIAEHIRGFLCLYEIYYGHVVRRE